MTNEQIVKEIQKNNDRIKNLEILYNNNSGLIRLLIFKTLKRTNISAYLLDDLMQIGYLALERAVTRFQADKGYKFTSFLAKYVRGYILRYGFPSSSLYDNIISLDTPLSVDEDLTLIDTIKDDNIIPFEEVAETAYLKIKLWEICKKKLTNEENTSIVKRFKYKKSLNTIAIEEATTPSRVNNYVSRGLRKLRHNKDIRNIGEDWGYIQNYSYRNVSLTEFNRTLTSATEWAVLKDLAREEELKVLRVF